MSQCGYPMGSSYGVISAWIPFSALSVGGNYHGATKAGWEDFQTEYDKQLARKLRLSSLGIYPNGVQRLFAGLFEPDDGTPVLPPRLDLDAGQYETVLKDAKSEGVHPISVSAYANETGQTLLAVVLHRDVPGLRWVSSTDLSHEGLQQELARQIGKGFHALLVTGYPRSNTSRYAAVWVDDHLRPPKRIGTDGTAPPVKTEMTQASPATRSGS
jgi:hypothetical protein